MATAYVNGKIYTMKSENDTVSAVVVEGGRFLYCGEDREARRIVAEGKAAGVWETGEVVDLKGKCVLPGFIDDHQHVQTYAKNALKIDLSDAASISEVQARIRARAAREPAGKLIQGCAFDDTRFQENRIPTRWDLDEAAPHNPVVITRCCTHIHVANSLALDMCGIRKEQELGGGYERDKNGELTGCLHEREAAELLNRITGGADLSWEELKDLVAEALHTCNRFGITGVHPIQGKLCNLFERTDLYQDLYDEGRLTARIYMGDDEFPGCAIRTGLGDDMLRYGFYKIYTDGSLGGRTALLTRPYHDVPGAPGACHYNQEQLDEMVKAAYDRRIQTGVHAIGDRAVEMTLLALKKAYEANPRPWDQIRFRLIHCSLVNETALELLKELRVIVDMQPGYVSTNIHWSDDRVGPDRAPCLFAWKTLTDLGLTLCGSSDHPCENLNPLVGVYAVETRSGYDGYLPEGWQPQERLSRYQAVCLYTKNPAYASFEEDRKGTIEAGKLADFAVFDRDVFGVAAPELLKVQVEKTYLGGREVYSRAWDLSKEFLEAEMEVQDKFLSLEGKVAIVTGAGSGIGLSVSQLYVKYGARVAMVDISEQCREEAEKIGAAAGFFRCNVCRETEVRATVEAVMAAFGRIDILVNNAGIIVRKTVLDTTEEEWDRCMDIGLKGVFLFSKHTVPIMMGQGGGVIVNTASGAAIKGVPDSAPYNAYKGGVAALTRGMAVDFGKYNIRVNCVCPGDILTPMLISEGLQTGKITTADPKTEEEREAMDRFLESCGSYRPLCRIATAEQIAYTFLYLATDMSVYATGASFVVDGGRCS